MKGSFFLAIQYLKFHLGRTLVLVFSISIIMFLPNGLRKLVDESERLMKERASSTPLIVGKKGSATDLVINSLYFQQEKIENLTLAKAQELNQTGFGISIPLFCAFQARDFPIVGTDLDYFKFRRIRLTEGRFMSVLGECVIGNNIAQELGIGVGDSLISSSEGFFDFAGVYPLKMNVVGVLEKVNSPDDNAIFTDLKTTWVIMGLGHGHQDLTTLNDPTIVMQRSDSNVVAGAKLFMYNEINADNLDSFHFHGNQSDYPITSTIFVPNSDKDETLLRGRFETGEISDQVIIPSRVIENLLESIFKLKQVFNSVFVAVAISTVLILGLIVLLSIRLREGEIKTMYTIGSSKGKIIEIISIELLVIILVSSVVGLVLYQLTGLFVEDFIYKYVI